MGQGESKPNATEYSLVAQVKNLRAMQETWVREGNGNPLQCSCLENSMDRGACHAAVHGVSQSVTQLSMHSPWQEERVRGGARAATERMATGGFGNMWPGVFICFCAPSSGCRSTRDWKVLRDVNCVYPGGLSLLKTFEIMFNSSVAHIEKCTHFKCTAQWLFTKWIYPCNQESPLCPSPSRSPQS